MSRSKKQPDDQRVMEAIHERLGQHGLKLEGSSFGAVRKRVRELLEHCPMEQVTLVALRLIDHHPQAFDVTTLNWGTYDWVIRGMKVPAGAWHYALWAYLEDDRQLSASVMFWLGRWMDNDGRSKAKVNEARRMLERLEMSHRGVEEISWHVD